jgi:outer membrane immunogenic protein
MLAGPAAFAADLPAPGPVYKAAPIYAPAFSWTGFYVGANAGWGWTSGDGTITLGGAPGSFSSSADGFLGGAQLGYNWQAGNLVYGLEADFQGGTGKGDINTTAGAATIASTAKVPWFSTFRGRLGYAFDRSMIYATGGAVYGKSTLEGTVSTTGAFSSSATFWTWTVGVGYERMFWDRWSAKVEYLYAGKPSDAAVPPGTTDLSGSAHTNIVRVGVNYHF